MLYHIDSAKPLMGEASYLRSCDVLARTVISGYRKERLKRIPNHRLLMHREQIHAIVATKSSTVFRSTQTIPSSTIHGPDIFRSLDVPHNILEATCILHGHQGGNLYVLLG